MKKVTLFGIICLGLIMVVGIAAQAKVTFKPNLYGYVKLDGAYDQNLTSHGNFVMWVNQRSNAQDDEQFNMTHRQSRFGVKINGEGYENAKVNAVVEADLYGGGTENKALILLRHAYFSIENQSFKMIAGQTSDMIAPLNPSTLNYSVLWGCGNIGYRRPQISLWYTIPAGQSSKVTVAGGVFRNMGDDLISLTLSTEGEAADGQDDGTDAGLPAAQGLFDFKYNWNEKGYFQVGASGLYGQLKAESDAGNDDEYDISGFSGHFALAFPQGHGFSGEVYSGTNLGGYNGAIGLAGTVDGVDSKGGWVSAWAKVSPQFTLGAGVGMDDPDDADVAANSRCKNQAYFGNIQYAVVPQASIGFELSQWETSYKGAEKAKNLRAQTSFTLNF